MNAFSLLSLFNTNIVPSNIKIHLATWNGLDDPKDVYLAGNFDDWQRWQNKRNFEREYVLSLISLPGHGRWLFAGVHRSSKPEWLAEHSSWYYPLQEEADFTDLNGRLIVSFSRPGRQPYLNAENWMQHMRVSEMLPERLSIHDFPGFKAVDLTKGELDLIVRQSCESWRTALSSVAGVYLITDTRSGKLYVGSATGEGGIWSRWTCYASDGHGGNCELQKLLKADMAHSNHFRYAILEIADVHSTKEDILRRESHWKNILMSRQYGLNAN